MRMRVAAFSTYALRYMGSHALSLFLVLVINKTLASFLSALSLVALILDSLYSSQGLSNIYATFKSHEREKIYTCFSRLSIEATAASAFFEFPCG